MKSRAPKNEASSSPARPSLPTFKKSKKGILGNPVNINLFSGNQVTTPIKSVRGPVSKGKDSKFSKAIPNETPSTSKRNSYQSPTSYLFPNQHHNQSTFFPNVTFGPHPFGAPHEQTTAQTSAQNETSSEVSIKCVYANYLSLLNKLPEIQAVSARQKALRYGLH